MRLEDFPCLNTFPRPTPLEEAPRLQAAIGCTPRIFIKRDDVTTAGLGGNKVRKLDFVLADPAAVAADAVITAGGVQSNHCRQTAALCARLGKECHLLLTGPQPATWQGNLLLDELFGATVHFITEPETLPEAFARVEAQLHQAGKSSYQIPIGASNALGALGYVQSMGEVLAQADELGIHVGAAFIASGSAGTHAGALAALELAGVRDALPLYGVSVSRTAAELQLLIADLATQALALLDQQAQIDPESVIVHDGYYDTYATPTASGIEAIRLLGRTEGLVLDPVYTGKVMAGMIDQLRQGAAADAEAVVFFHTGGSPAVFAYADEFQPR